MQGQLTQAARAAGSIGITGLIGSGKSHVRKFLGALGAVTLDADPIAHEVYAPGTQTMAQLEEAFGAGILDAQGGVNREVLGDLVFHHAHAAENMKKLTSIVWPATRSLVVSRVQDLCEVARRQPPHAYHANLLQGLASGAVQETLRAGDAASVAEVAAWLPPAGQAALEGGGELPTESTPALLLPGSAETVQGSSAMPVVVLEASTLLQAGWADAVDVVWATSVSAECAVTRVMQRNALSRQQASERVQLQIQQLRDAAAEIDLTIDSSGSMQETRLAVSRAWLGRLVAMHGRGEVTVEDSR